MEQDTGVNYAGDFRSEALLASTRFCEEAGIQFAPHDLTQFGTSLCLPASDDPRAELKVIRRAMLKWHLTMACFVLCGIAMVAAAAKGPWNTPLGSFRTPIWAGAIPLIGGWLMMCGSVNAEHWIIRRRIAARGTDAVPFSVSEAPCMLRIEDPATYKTVKLVIDDVAIGWCDATRGVMQLEGFAYRYVLWSKDIRSLKQLGNRFVELTCSVGGSDQFLTLAVAMNGAAIELKKQLSFGIANRAVEAPLRRVFGLPIPWDRSYSRAK